MDTARWIVEPEPASKLEVTEHSALPEWVTPTEALGLLAQAVLLNRLRRQMDHLRLEHAWASVECTTECGVPGP